MPAVLGQVPDAAAQYLHNPINPEVGVSERNVNSHYHSAADLCLTRTQSPAKTSGLLRRHSQNVARCCPALPDVPFDCSAKGWVWLDVARDLGSLAPSLAPRNLVSKTNVRMLEPSDGYRIASPGRRCTD